MNQHERMKEYYERRAPEYDDSIPGLGDKVWRPEMIEDRSGLFRALKKLPPAMILDVGCGTGFLTTWLGDEVTGLDQSESMLRIARRRVPSAAFVKGDALQMPFSDDAFDRVFASSFYGLLELPERQRFLDEVSRVANELVLVELTPAFGPSGMTEAWEERTLSDGSSYRIHRHYFDAAGLAAEIAGEILFEGKWTVMVGGRR